MKLHYFIPGLMLAIGLFATAYLIARRSQPSQSAELTASDSDRRPGVEDDVARLEAALAQTQERLRHIEATMADHGKQSTASTIPLKVPSTSNPEQLKREFLDRIQSAIAKPRNENWARPTEEKILSLTKSAMPADVRYEIKSLSCQTDVCRLEVIHYSLEDQQAFSRVFALRQASPDLDGAHFQTSEPNADGSHRLDVFLFRRGSHLMRGAEDNQ